MAKSPAPKTYLAHVAYISGKAFRANAEAFLSKIPPKRDAAASFAVSRVGELAAAVTNLAFSVELFLKSILVRTPAAVSRGHNLLKLFEGLSAENQSNFEATYKTNAQQLSPEAAEGFTLFITPGKTEAQRNAPRKATANPSGRTDLRILLRNEGDAFETWRYLYEAQEEGEPICYQIEFAYLQIFADMLEKSVAETFAESTR